MLADKKVIRAYLIFEVIVFLMIKIGEYTTPQSVYCKFMYAAIVGDFLCAAYLYITYGRKQILYENLIPLGITITLFADFFLTLLSKYTTVGYILFCLVEITYAVYLKVDRRNLIIRILFAVIALTVLYLAKMFTVGNAIGLFNITLVCGNMVCAWQRYGRNHRTDYLFFAIGIMLFFGCDFGIMLRTLSSGLFHEVIAFFVWVFYVPAQVMIVLSYWIKERNT